MNFILILNIDVDVDAIASKMLDVDVDVDAIASKMLDVIVLMWFSYEIDPRKDPRECCRWFSDYTDPSIIFLFKANGVAALLS